MNYIIRKKELRDCKGVAHVVAVAWNETYKGLIPDWYLEELNNNEDERAERSRNNFDEKKNYQFVLEIDGEIVGFVKYGLAKEEELADCGEIIALYIIQKYKGNGLGRKLVEAAVKELKNMGCDKMIIACLKGNPTNEFYKHIGGKYLKDGVYEKLNLPENVYYFDI